MLMVPPGTVVGVTVIAAHAEVVNEIVVSPAIRSGGSLMSSSVTSLPTILSVQEVANGNGVAGCRVNVVAGDAGVTVSAIGVPHCSANAVAVTLTGSLNVTTRSAPTGTFVAPFAGTVVVTVGGSSSVGFFSVDPMKMPLPPAAGS